MGIQFPSSPVVSFPLSCFDGTAHPGKVVFSGDGDLWNAFLHNFHEFFLPYVTC